MQSKVKGVSWQKIRKSWSVKVYTDGIPETIYHGKDKKEAERTRLEWDKRKEPTGIPQSGVVGVTCNMSAKTPKWYARRHSGDKTLVIYRGGSQKDAENAMKKYNKLNPKKPYVYHRKPWDYVVPQIDWPASKLSWELKQTQE